MDIKFNLVESKKYYDGVVHSFTCEVDGVLISEIYAEDKDPETKLFCIQIQDDYDDKESAIERFFERIRQRIYSLPQDSLTVWNPASE